MKKPGKDLKQCFASELEKYLAETGFTVPRCIHDESMHTRLVDGLRSRGIDADCIEAHLEGLQASTLIAQCSYPFVSTKVRDYIALFTALMILVEDTSKQHSSHLRDFHSCMLRREPQPNKILQAVEEVLRDSEEIYGPFTSALIVKGVLDFISASAIEAEYHGRLLLTEQAPCFPFFMRWRTGVGEGYALFCFPEYLYPESSFWPVIYPLVPDMARFVLLGNDFFSYYKESILSDESLNYMSTHARCNSLTVLQSIKDTRAETAASVCRLKTALSAYPDLQSYWDQFKNGYEAYHLGAARYKLLELGVPAAMEVSKLVKMPKSCEGATQVPAER